MDSTSTRVSANPTMPNNAQLQQTIQNTRAALDDAKLDAPLNSKGQILVEDAKQLLDSTGRLIAEKNQDERMQRMVGNSFYAAKDTRTGMSGQQPNLPRGELDGMRTEAREAYYASKDLVMMCVRSRQFRDIMMELVEVLQTMLKSTTDKMGQSSQLNPTQVASQLANETVVPDEQKQQLFNRVQHLLTQLSARPEYSAAIEHLFTVFDHLQTTSGQLRTQAQDVSATSAVPTDKYNDILQDATIILEQFSGAGTVEEFKRKINFLFGAIRQDEQAKAYFTEVRVFIREVLRTPAVLQDQQRVNYAKNLVERGRVLMNGKYRPYFSDVTDQLKTVFTNIRNDSVTQDFSTKLSKFVSDFAFDEQGRPDLFVLQNSFSQMKSFMVPMLSRALNNLPVPRIQGSNDKYDFAIDGLILSVGDLLPDFIDVRTKTDNRMNVQHLAGDKRSTKIVMEVERIRALFRNIHFWYRRKHMPRLEDEGVADVDLSQGTGLTLKLVWKLSSVNGQPYQLRLSRVLCNISKLKIVIRNARHNILDKLVTKLFAGMIKKAIATAIVNNIQKYVEPLGAKLNALFKTKPAHGFADRLNTQMKNTLFTGNSDQNSLVSRARGAITQGAQQMKQRRQRHGPMFRPTLGDMNGNGIPDYLERGVSTRPTLGDMNGNGIPDYLERGVPTTAYTGDFVHTPEWETNYQWYTPSRGFATTGYPTRGGAFADRDMDGIPDFLETSTVGRTSSYGDRNRNGIPDYLETSNVGRTSSFGDRNRNGIPDYLETSPVGRTSSFGDRNRNGIPDYLETSNVGRTSSFGDRNRNGVPDYMENRRPTFFNGEVVDDDEYDLDDEFDAIELDETDVHNDNKWTNTKWNSNSKFDKYNDVDHDWTRGTAGYDRYTSL